ncbi:MAG: acetyl-CoA carboxylase, biotin carboxyl carrier protein [Gemmatimonadetes bacterium]|nr:acetyl-CoA carboxylase, biotin carboxyl carrier protein [Gemmatimonadota bacterium]
MIDLEFLQKLLDLLNRSEADTIEIRKWTTTIKVSRHNPASTSHLPAPPSPGRRDEGGGREEGGERGEEGGSREVAVEPPPDLTEIKSPMVGTFYAQPEPGTEPYVRVGSRIDPGKTLCIIEAMKIMNPLISEVSGVVAEIPVEDAQPIEFGQVLFRVNPNG